MAVRKETMYSLLFLIFLALIVPSHPKTQYVEPLLFGMKVNISYDIANLFNRYPLQGGLSVILALALMYVIFFGVLTSPFGYAFGFPSPTYVQGDLKVKHPEKDTSRALQSLSETAERSFLLDYVLSEKNTPRTIFSDQRDREDEAVCCQTFLWYFDGFLGYLEFWEPGFLKSWKPSLDVLRGRLGGKVGKEIVNTLESTLNTQYVPDFITSLFYLIPDNDSGIRNDPCQKRILCHAHGALRYLPVTMLKMYHKFSKKLQKIPTGYVEAIRTGMRNETFCSEMYSECEDNAFSLTLKSYMSMLPDKTQISRMPRRKQKMYMNL